MKEQILIFKSLPSTNQYLRDNYLHLTNKQIVIAEHQTAGKGRGENIWLDQENTSLLISFLFKENNQNFISNHLVMAMGLALNKAIKLFVACQLKWPNDIIVNNKKIAGILIERLTKAPQIIYIVGIGLNINQSSFAPKLATKATSLSLELGTKLSIKDVQEKVIKSIFAEYDKLCNNNLPIAEYKEALFYLNKKIIYRDKEYKIIDVNNLGELIITDGAEVLEINSGQISYFDLPNY